MSEELKKIREKKGDIRWIINHLNEVIEYFENMSSFQETDIDFSGMSLAYHNIIEIVEALQIQHNNYPKST